jgi:DNA mismatch repair protein MutL
VVTRITVLPESIATRIAAGEVVERPSSIVKELVENAIDAGARRVTVEVRGGGRELIRVTDDGEGMSAEDARLAFRRHATSKLRDPEDLFAIRTLGFRGEALPSIASVARVRLETQAEGAPVGTAIELAGGKAVSEGEGAFPRGTRITVEDVFYNVPARRKFLKSDTWELGQITTYCTHYALAFPGIHFVLTSGAFEILAAPPAASHRERLLQVFGPELVDDLVEYETADDRAGVGMRVFTSRPHVQKRSRKSMFFFVNGRAVRDRALLHACTDAYRNVLPSGTFPVTMLFVTAKPGDIDVNVHPAKTEIRFRKGAEVHDAVRAAVSGALRSDRTIIPMKSEALGAASAWKAPEIRGRIPDSWREPVADPPGRVERLPVDRANAGARDIPYAEAAGVVGAGAAGARAPGFDLVRRELRPLGQLRDSFIVAVDTNGLVLIDQHVAHERVLFEDYLRDRSRDRVEVQRLLTPLVMEVSPSEEVVLERTREELEACGFETVPFGPRTISVLTAPAMLGPSGVEILLGELVGGLEREHREIDLETFRRKIAATVSCHAAIKINNPLDSVKMQWLVGELMRTDCPTVCPHGRPIIVRYDLSEIHKAFKRV